MWSISVGPSEIVDDGLGPNPTGRRQLECQSAVDFSSVRGGAEHVSAAIHNESSGRNSAVEPTAKRVQYLLCPSIAARRTQLEHHPAALTETGTAAAITSRAVQV